MGLILLRHKDTKKYLHRKYKSNYNRWSGKLEDYFTADIPIDAAMYASLAAARSSFYCYGYSEHEYTKSRNKPGWPEFNKLSEEEQRKWKWHKYPGGFPPYVEVWELLPCVDSKVQLRKIHHMEDK